MSKMRTMLHKYLRTLSGRERTMSFSRAEAIVEETIGAKIPYRSPHVTRESAERAFGRAYMEKWSAYGRFVSWDLDIPRRDRYALKAREPKMIHWQSDSWRLRAEAKRRIHEGTTLPSKTIHMDTHAGCCKRIKAVPDRLTSDPSLVTCRSCKSKMTRLINRCIGKRTDIPLPNILGTGGVTHNRHNQDGIHHRSHKITFGISTAKRVHSGEPERINWMKLQ